MKISILAVAIFLALPSSASAAVIVGADNLAQNPGSGPPTCGALPGEPCSSYTVTQHDGIAENGSPINGVLVSARVVTSGAAATVAVRVLRPNPMMANTNLNLAPEILIPVTAEATAPGHTTEATGLHHPINAGDRLGVGFTQPATSFAIAGNAAPSMAACAFRQGAGNDHPVSTERTYSTAGCNGFELLVQGTVEPDADGDTFGDETQDQCPTQPTPTGGPCPVPTSQAPQPTATPTAPKKKCKKKPKGASAAKKKCKKKG